MKDKIKKNKKIVLLCSGILVIAVLAVSISLLTREDEFADAEFDPKDILKIHIKTNESGNIYSSNEFVLEQTENIEKVLGYVRKMASNELKTSVNGVTAGEYEFTYYFKNGKSKKYTHSFLSVTSDDGFETVFLLKEVIPQVFHVFTTKNDDVKEVVLYVWPSEDAVEPHSQVLTDDEINEILKFGQENMLQDNIEAQKERPCGVQFTDYNDEPIFIVYISPDMYKYDELCEKVPKVKEFAEMIGK